MLARILGEVGNARGRLYLVSLRSVLHDEVPLARLFDGFYEAVFAHWFTGTVLLASPEAGHQEPLVPEFPPPMPLTFKNGVLTETDRRRYSALSMGKRASDAPALAHLKAKVSTSSVERDEMVDDPLGYVPAKPFGHHNWRWEQFKASIPEGGSIWSFERDSDWQLYSGYASVGGSLSSFGLRRIEQFILTSIAET